MSVQRYYPETYHRPEVLRSLLRPSRHELPARQGNDQRGTVPAHKGTEGKAERKEQEGQPFGTQPPGVFSEIDQQGAAAAQVEEKNVQPFKIHPFRCDKMMEKATGHGDGHYDPEGNLEVLVHFFTPSL